MRGLRKLFKSRYNKMYIKNNITDDSVQKLENDRVSETITSDITYDLPVASNIFVLNMQKYIGETVTVFVNAGGISGLGFTGVLLNVNSTYIQLITVIGPAPGCALYNECFSKIYCRFAIPKQNHVNTLGAISYIAVDKIVSFVHNLV